MALEHLIGWTYLDYKSKLVFTRKDEWYNSTWQVPATQEEHSAFQKNFAEKGKKQCTFREFKEFCKFHGVKKNHRKYGQINLSKHHFQVLTQYLPNIGKDSFENALERLISESFKLRRNASANGNSSNGKTIEVLLETIKKLSS